MKLIAHRGLIYGPDRELENKESTINFALQQGFDCEVDVWYVDNNWYLGHDYFSTPTTIDFISQPGLWLHAKNFEASDQLRILLDDVKHLNFFWHDHDKRTLTSQNYWWTYPDNLVGKNSIALMPEWSLDQADINECLSWNCAGICSDYVHILRKFYDA